MSTELVEGNEGGPWCGAYVVAMRRPPSRTSQAVRAAAPVVPFPELGPAAGPRARRPAPFAAVLTTPAVRCAIASPKALESARSSTIGSVSATASYTKWPPMTRHGGASANARKRFTCEAIAALRATLASSATIPKRSTTMASTSPSSNWASASKSASY